MAWTIEIDGTVRSYKKITFKRSLASEPVGFSATIKYYSDINYWDVVEIINGSTTEWYGYVEKKKVGWDEEGVFIDISGRCRKAILWKKWTERFTDTRIKGYFGSVNTTELLKWLIRCPVSDNPTDENDEPIPNHKIGWGIASRNLQARASPTTTDTDPAWVKMRYTGLAWRNRGTKYNGIVRKVNSWTAGATPWTKTGSSPYLHDAGSEPEELNKIDTVTIGASDDFGFENLPVDATGINSIFLQFYLKTDGPWTPYQRAAIDVYLWRESDSSWVWLVGLSVLQPTWKKFTIDALPVILTADDVNNCKVRFKYIGTSWLVDLPCHITQAWLNVDYSTGGAQGINDYVVIDVATASDAMGILIESRKSGDQFAKNYNIQYSNADDPDPVDGMTYTKENFLTYQEVDVGADRIQRTGNPSYHIDHLARSDETTYVYKDFGVDNFDGFEHLVEGTAQSPSGSGRGVVWALSNDLSDYYDWVNTNQQAVYLELRYLAGPARLQMELGDAESASADISVALVLGTKYYLRIKRVAGSATVTCEIYTTSADRESEVNQVDTLNISIPAARKYQYCFACNTWNDGLTTSITNDIDNLILSSGTPSSDWTDFPTAISVTDNTYRDILHSWRPTTLKHIRIKITAADTTVAWEISQIYVYKAEVLKYRVVLDGVSAPAAPPPYLGGPYLGTISLDANFDAPTNNLNLPFARLIDNVEVIAKRLHSNYVPFEWWVNLSNGNINFANRKGSDLSGSISFVKGTNLGGAEKDDDVSKTVQRTRFLGKSESKKQDDVSSDWKVSTDDMDDVRTFYEEIKSAKTADKKEVADLLANIFISENAPPEEMIVCTVTNDTYSALAYDVGDDVTITDSLTGVSGAHRIHTIKKVITKNGEQITLYLDATYQDVESEWAIIHRKLRQLELTGTAVADWLAEGSSQGKQSSVKAETDKFEAEAKNDTEDAGDDKTDEKWTVSGEAVGALLTIGDSWMSMAGTTGTTQQVVEGYINNRILHLDQNPKMVFEFKIVEDGSYSAWEQDDIFDVWIGTFITAPKGIGFRIFRDDGVYKFYVLLRDHTTTKLILVKNVAANTKYRFEAVMDFESKVALYYLQDATVASTIKLSLVALLELDAAFPPEDYDLVPLYIRMTSQKAVGGNGAKIYIYRYKSEWEARQV